ncbi:MAG: hypothetical protein JO286_20490 [Solirubrobacterales bacterium]|nr:hypothetical protein [Solirubrobacterales bacterium]MBV9365328.1 hypothetical protein [Solirubrobacterales bacterium]MBV9809574.1 hypothetical protein [Solirubrobacterales bacterium]
MRRQRVRERSSILLLAGRLVALLLGAALVWYGLMTLLLAVKVSPATVNSLSGYRTAFNWITGLTPADVDGSSTRAIIAGAGVVAFLLFGYLAFKQLPRPYLARRDLPLFSDDRGEFKIEPRAVERLAEIAATRHPEVGDARSRYSVDDLSVDLTVRRARNVATTLRETQERVAEALADHELPTMPVNVTLTGYDRRDRREIR